MNREQAIDRVAHMLKQLDDNAIQNAALNLCAIATIDRKEIDYRKLADERIGGKLLQIAVEAIHDDLFPS
jgi:hypothetical protein